MSGGVSEVSGQGSAHSRLYGKPRAAQRQLGAGGSRRDHARQSRSGWRTGRGPADRRLVVASTLVHVSSVMQALSQILRDVPKSYLGLSVELEGGIGLSGHPKLVYYNVV